MEVPKSKKPLTERSTKDYIKKLGFDTYVSVVNSITNPLKEDQYESNGYLTPEQFVLAGDFLTNSCRTWNWEGGDPTKAFTFLPKDKQFIMTRRVPCSKRVREIEQINTDLEDIDHGEIGEGWSLTMPDHISTAENEIPEIEEVEADN